MARYKKKTPPPDVNAANSWRGRWVRDAYENNFGMISAVEQDGDDVLLKARFLGEDGKERVLHIEPREDGEFLFPNEVKARYRPATDDEVRQHLKSQK